MIFDYISNLISDKITKFAGSLLFVFIHTVLFAVWCSTGLFGHDRFPFNFLTLAVSLEAIYLSTFILIAQNRQAEKDRLVIINDAEYDLETLGIVRRLLELQDIQNDSARTPSSISTTIRYADPGSGSFGSSG